MRPNLSLDHFAAVLATIGASALVACGGSQPQPVQANEVAAPAAVRVDCHAGEASCSASGRGASKGAAAATAARGAPRDHRGERDDHRRRPIAPSACGPCGERRARRRVSPRPPRRAAPPAAKPVAKKKKAAPAGEASCGAGTCASNTKKIL